MQIPQVLQKPLAGDDTCSQYSLYTITILRSVRPPFHFLFYFNYPVLGNTDKFNEIGLLQRGFFKDNEIWKALNTLEQDIRNPFKKPLLI